MFHIASQRLIRGWELCDIYQKVMVSRLWLVDPRGRYPHAFQTEFYGEGAWHHVTIGWRDDINSGILRGWCSG
jgi:hypothetical protein